jgi:hypothetical protein
MSDNYSILISKLDEFIRKYYRNRLLRGTILFFAILLVSFLVITALEYIGHFAPFIRTLLFYFFLLVNAGIFIWFVVDPLLKIRKIGKIITHEQASEIIGKFFGDIQDKLLNTLQLRKLVDSGEIDTELLKAGIEQKIAKLKPIPFVSAIDLSKNKKFLKFVLPPFFVLLLLLFIAPSFVTNPSERILHHSRIYRQESPFRLLILNKNLTAFQQDDFTLKVKVTGEKIPDEVTLESNGTSFKMIKESKIFFSYTFKSLQQSVKFYLGAGNFKSSEYELRVYPKPTILNFQAELMFPGYLGRKSEILENTGDLILPEGTNVKWTFYTKDAETVLINIDSTVRKLGNKGGNSFIYSGTFFKSGHYSFKAINSYVARPDSLNYTITVIPDSHPSISVIQTKDSVLITRLYFLGIIKDDYGFSRLTFHYTLTQGGDTTQKEAKTENVPLNKSLNQQQFFYSADISQYLANPGDEMDYYFEVCDNDGLHGPKCTRSSSFRYKMPTLDEIENQTSVQEQNITKNIEQAIQDAKKLQKQIDEMNKKLVDKNTLSWQDKKQLQDLLEKQKQIKESLSKIQQENEQKSSYEDQFKNIDPTILEKQNQLNELFNQVMDENTKKMVEEIKKLLDKVDKNQVSQMLEKMKLSNKDIEKQLDRSLELFKQVEFEKNLSEMIDKLNKLAEKQDQLSEKSKDKKESNDNLKEKQNEVNREFDDAKKKLEELTKKNSELEEPNKLPNVEKDEENIKKDLEEAMENLKKNDPKAASKAQKNAANQMKSMAMKMKDAKDDMESEELAEDAEKLRQILENLIRISFNQEEILNQTKLVNRNDPKYLTLIQGQNDLKDDLKVVEDSLYQLAKRQIMIKPFIMREISAINQNISDGVKYLNDRNISSAATRQQFVMTSVNNLALMLSEVQKQMQVSLSMSCKNKGKSSCSKPGGTGQSSMKSMRKLQEQLNKQMKGLKDGLESGKKEGKGKSSKPGEQGMSEQLARLAAEQEALRGEMKKYLDKLNEQGINDGGGMNDAMKQMEQTEKDLVNKKILQETLTRQEQILTRLLESEKAELQREQEEKRKSTEAKNPKISNPSSNFQYNIQKTQSVELIKTVQPAYNYFFKNKINGYFLKFER